MAIMDALIIASAVLGLLIAAWLLSAFRACPEDKVLFISGRGTQPQDRSNRIARTRTWINPLSEKVQELSLTPIHCHIAARLPIGNSATKPLYIQLALALAPGSDDTSLSRAARHFAGLNSAQIAEKLQTLLKDWRVPPPLVPSAASGLSNANLKANSNWSDWISATFAPVGLIVKSWSAVEISESARFSAAVRRTTYDPSLGASSTLESDLSLACRDLDFDDIGEVLTIDLPSNQSTLGAVAVKWFLVTGLNEDIEQFALACDKFLGASGIEANSVLSKIVSDCVHRALKESDGYRLIDVLCESFKNSGAGSSSSGKALAVFVLNALADTASTWRGKLTMMRVCVTSTHTAQKFFSTVTNALTAALPQCGLRYKGFVFLDIDLQTSSLALPANWDDAPSAVPRKFVEFKSRTPVIFDGRIFTVIVSARAELPGAELPGAELPALTEALSKHLSAAMSTPKLRKAVSALEEIVNTVRPDIEQLRSMPDNAENGPLARSIVLSSAVRLIMPTVRLVLSVLETYAEVRNQFVKSCKRHASLTGGTVRQFAVADLDILDENGESIFIVTPSSDDSSSAQETATEALLRLPDKSRAQ